MRTHIPKGHPGFKERRQESSGFGLGVTLIVDKSTGSALGRDYIEVIAKLKVPRLV